MTTPRRDPEFAPTELEMDLARMRPAPIGLSRDRMLFEAGRAEGRAERNGRFGLGLAAGLALIAGGLGGLLVQERTSRNDLEVKLATLTSRASSVARVPVAPIDDSQSLQAAQNSYLVLTRHILSGGAGSTPSELPRLSRDDSSIVPTAPPAPLRVQEYGRLLEL